jgi:hypothetical protein
MESKHRRKEGIYLEKGGKRKQSAPRREVGQPGAIHCLCGDAHTLRLQMKISSVATPTLSLLVSRHGGYHPYESERYMFHGFDKGGEVVSRW